MKSKLMSLGVLLCTLLVSMPGRTEDIDLFVGTPPSSTGNVPNVLIVLDNTANWNTAFVNEKAALVSLFNGLPVDKFRVGLMMFTETGSGNSGNDGAYVRAAIRLMNSTNKPIYASMINSLDQTGDKSNGGKIGKAMWEAHLYLSGGTPHAGNNKGKTDYTGNTSGTTQDDAICMLPDNALLTKSATTYLSPQPYPCAKNYIIYISNGPAQDNSSDTTQATTALLNAGGVTTTIPLNPSGSQDNVADEWVRFMKTGPSCSIAKMVAYNNSSGTAPSVTNYTDACIVGVSSGNLASVNASVLAQAATGVDTRAEIQGLVPCTLGTGALAKIEAYNNGNGTTPPALTVADYTDACVKGVTSGNLTRINALVLAQATGAADTTVEVQELVYTADDAGTTTYTLDVNKGSTGQGPGWTALLKSMAAVSGGKYFDVTSSGTQIVDALNGIFSEIQSVNSVFASVSLPVSVNTQGTYLNQVYVGMFRPDSDSNPRWAGNLKQYKIGQPSSTTLELQDADSKNAINNQTGFITECARSYWTPSTVDTEWAFRPQGDCLTVANSQASNYPDGNVVEKGAQAYKLRESSTRTVYTCTGTCTTLASFSAGTSGLSSTLVDWAIGKDMQDEDIDGVTSTERRLSAHGDVVHSRPVAVDFGSTGAPNVVVFYGANDGMLRAVNGNRTNAIGSIPAGGELWSFMPPEFFSSISRLYNNTPAISYPGSGGGSPKSYGMDGPITAFKGTVGGSSKVFVYASMRRGGRSIYAFDASNSATAPASPTLKWKAGCPNLANDTGCTSNGASLSGIGQTWSSVKSFTTAGYGSGASPLLIFGGGYDTCEDHDAGAGGANNNCTASSKGHYVYVLDADTGAVVKTFDTGGTRGIIADVTLVRDSTDQVIYGYTADLGGNVYRIAFGGGAPSSWTMTKIASLGCSSTATCTANRKFVFAPSVVSVDGNYAIMLGSGDREKPLTNFGAASAVTNYFFMFTDKPTVAAASYPGSTDCGSNVICIPSLLGITDTTTPDATALAAKKGWYLGLNSTEQVVTSAITIFGTVSFSTHQPAVPNSASCSANLGTARVYNVNYLNAAPSSGTDRWGDLAGDGLPPSPVGGKVQLDNGSLVPFCIGCGKDSPLAPTLPTEGGGGTARKSRLYWYIQK